MTPEYEADLDTRLDWMIQVIGDARPVPLSSSVMVNKDELMQMVQDMKAALPVELRQARWMLRERDDFIARTRREAQDILDEANLQAERKVSQTDIVAEAVRTADRVIEEARETARNLRLEAEDYIDQRLANFETVLGKITQTVRKGRERLHALPPMEGDDMMSPFERPNQPYDQDQPSLSE